MDPPHEPLRSLGIEDRKVRLVGIPLIQTVVPKWCNDNNNPGCDWTYGHTITAQQYQELSEHSMRKNWMHLQPSDGVITITLTPADVILLHDSSKSGIHTGRRPMSESFELNELERRMPALTDGGHYFIRLDQCSPKDSIHQAGPLTKRSEIIDCLVTSVRVHREFAREAAQKEGLNVYLVPWRKEWASWIEFRCFCYRRRIAAFSQYNWPRDVGLSTWGDDALLRCAARIVQFCERDIVPKLSDRTGGHWVIDVILSKEDLAPHFVEVNPFGAELSSGSALFNWIRDKEILYGDGSVVEFRYVTPNPETYARAVTARSHN